MHLESEAGAKQIRQAMVLPVEHVVEFAVQQEAFGAISPIVQDNDDRIELATHGRAQLHAGHLKGTVADQYQWPQLRIGTLSANGAGYGEAHARVERRPDKLGLLANCQV